MSEEEKELPVADSWYSKQCECPHCREVIETEGYEGDSETCYKCGRKFELGEFKL